MTTLLHISDTHFGTEQAPVVEALVRLSNDLSPDLLVLSGDITQRARPEQFAAARRFVERLGVPRLVIPGNHDIPLFNGVARLLFPYARFQSTFGETLEPMHDSADLLVLCVKTTRRLRHVEGQVSAAQIERVALRLHSARPGQLRVVVVHQPLHVEGETEKKHLLRGCEAALQHWAAAGADVALGGHIHLPYVRELSPAGAGGARIVVRAGRHRVVEPRAARCAELGQCDPVRCHRRSRLRDRALGFRRAAQHLRTRRSTPLQPELAPGSSPSAGAGTMTRSAPGRTR